MKYCESEITFKFFLWSDVYQHELVYVVHFFLHLVHLTIILGEL